MGEKLCEQVNKGHSAFVGEWLDEEVYNQPSGAFVKVEQLIVSLVLDGALPIQEFPRVSDVVGSNLFAA